MQRYEQQPLHQEPLLWGTREAAAWLLQPLHQELLLRSSRVAALVGVQQLPGLAPGPALIGGPNKQGCPEGLINAPRHPPAACCCFGGGGGGCGCRVLSAPLGRGRVAALGRPAVPLPTH